MKQYFYIDSNNQQVGPINEDALLVLVKNGIVSSLANVWTEGLADWQPVCAVFPESAKETCIPPLGVEPSTTVPEAPAASLPQDLPKLWSKYRKLFIIGGAVALIAAFSFTAYFVSDSGDSSSPVSATAKKKRFKPRKISREKAVKELRELGVISSELDIQTRVGSGAMANACAQGNINITELLLAGGINVAQMNDYDVLLGAAKNGHTEVVRLLLAIPGIEVNEDYPLERAVRNGHTEVVKLLLAAPGIDVNKERNVESENPYSTALSRAAENGHTEIVKLLLAAPGIDVNVMGPLRDAAKKGHTEIVKLLLAAPGIDVNDLGPLSDAAARGHTEIVKLLLAAPGIDVNKGDPLAEAAKNGHAEVVKLLLAAPGIDVNKKCLVLGISVDDHDSNSTPLERAAENGHTEIVKLLLAAPGIDVNAGEPLRYAAENGHTEVVQLLLAMPGINVNKVDERGYTPLERARWAGYTEIVNLLRAAGAQ